MCKDLVQDNVIKAKTAEHIISWEANRLNSKRCYLKLLRIKCIMISYLEMENSSYIYFSLKLYEFFLDSRILSGLSRRIQLLFTEDKSEHDGKKQKFSKDRL